MKNIKLFIYSSYGGMAELVDALDSKSSTRKGVRVRVPSGLHYK